MKKSQRERKKALDRDVLLVDCPVCGAGWMTRCTSGTGTPRDVHGTRRLVAFSEGLISQRFNEDKNAMEWVRLSFDEMPEYDDLDKTPEGR